jgi:hypothetical protein
VRVVDSLSQIFSGKVLQQLSPTNLKHVVCNYHEADMALLDQVRILTAAFSGTLELFSLSF